MQALIEIIKYTKRLWRYVAFLAVGSVVLSLLGLAVPFVIKFATDAIVGLISGQSSLDASVVFWFAGILFVISIVSGILNDIVGYYGDVLAVRLRQQLSNLYYKHLLELPQSYYDSEITGKIINRLNRAIDNVTTFINRFANNLLQLVITLIISIAIMMYYSWILGALILTLFPIYIWLTGKTSIKWQALEKKKNYHFDIASGRFNEVIQQIRLVKAFGTESREYSSFTSRFRSMVGLTKNQSKHWHKMNALRNSFLALVYLGVYSVLFYDTATGAMTLGDMVMLLTLVQRVSGPLGGMSMFIDMYQRAVANARDYITAMQAEPEAKDTKLPDLVLKSATIEFDKVNFAYEGKDVVLRDVSFSLSPGKKLALVGESGGGKSTITNLLMGLYRPTSGTIKVGGQDISQTNLPSLRSYIATVFQDPGLFSGTFRENIAYGRPDASTQEIIRAAKSANAYDFISEHADGLETEIGERGIKLSGGQKQRLAIARAFLKNAPILILDEATSSLDSKSELLIQDALDDLVQDRTVIVVAHRLSTIAGVDQIATLKRGRIDETGTPAQLAKSGGIYAELLKLQLGASERSRKQLEKFDIAE